LTDNHSGDADSSDTHSSDTHSSDAHSSDAHPGHDGQFDVAAFDLDGTLVDSNYQHSLAWFRAFRAHDITLPIWRIHRSIGMGGDQLVAEVAGDDVEERLGDDLRERWAKEFEPMMAEIVAFAGARDLLITARERGFKVVLASSGAAEQTNHYIDLLDARDLIDAYTTSEDVESTKPAPDLVNVALKKVKGRRGILLGDSTWDCQSAAKAGAASYALRTGGFSKEELEAAGAAGVYESLTELIEDLDNTSLSQAGR
jgi:HAD superfamily hydrolase (TIGR01549 family)